MNLVRKPRSLVPIPRQLAADIDRIAGHRRRAQFVIEVVEQELRRREQLQALHQAAGSWPDADHPELADGGDPWIRDLRQKSLKRLKDMAERPETD